MVFGKEFNSSSHGQIRCLTLVAVVIVERRSSYFSPDLLKLSPARLNACCYFMGVDVGVIAAWFHIQKTPSVIM